MAQLSQGEKRRNTLIVIVGPTASGKSDLGVQLAKKFNGEVVSADSRQMYRGLDIGSGKITQKEMLGIPHHLLDIASPKRKFTVAQYKTLAVKAIRDIQRRGKLPIVVGGSPFYVYAIVDNLEFPKVKANPKLRAELEKLTAEALLAKLKKLDPERVLVLQQSSGQEKNKRRLIRAIEIVTATGKPVPVFEVRLQTFQTSSSFEILIIGMKRTPEELRQKIHKRLLGWVKKGMLNEIKNLHAQGVSWKRFEEFGLEYKYGAQYLQGIISKQQMVDLSQKSLEDFARRQMLWFTRDGFDKRTTSSRIHWIESQKQAEQLVQEFTEVSG